MPLEKSEIDKIRYEVLPRIFRVDLNRMATEDGYIALIPILKQLHWQTGVEIFRDITRKQFITLKHVKGIPKQPVELIKENSGVYKLSECVKKELRNEINHRLDEFATMPEEMQINHKKLILEVRQTILSTIKSRDIFPSDLNLWDSTPIRGDANRIKNAATYQEEFYKAMDKVIDYTARENTIQFILNDVMHERLFEDKKNLQKEIGRLDKALLKAPKSFKIEITSFIYYLKQITTDIEILEFLFKDAVAGNPNSYTDEMKQLRIKISNSINTCQANMKVFEKQIKVKMDEYNNKDQKLKNGYNCFEKLFFCIIEKTKSVLSRLKAQESYNRYMSSLNKVSDTFKKMAFFKLQHTTKHEEVISKGPKESKTKAVEQANRAEKVEREVPRKRVHFNIASPMLL